MKKDPPRLFHILKPGITLPGDWFHGSIPTNIEVGENTVIDSSSCFKNYHSQLPVGFRAGANCTFWRTSIAAEENALIEVGDYTYIANASLVASEKISIGSYVLVAGGVTIADSDFHPVDPAARLADTVALSPIGKRHKRPPVSIRPVVIEDDVWIGYNATILKGVVIGTGSTVAPGSVVIQNVPPMTVVAGNPARVVSEAG